MASVWNFARRQERGGGDAGADACQPGDVRGRGALLGWGVPIAMIVLGSFLDEWILWLWTPAFLVIGITCVINAARCGRLHCYVTGPIFLVGAVILALIALGLLPISWVGGIGYTALGGTALAYASEWLLGRRYVHS